MVIKVEHEENSEVIWIDRDNERSNCVYVPSWGDTNELVRAVKVISRLSWN